MEKLNITNLRRKRDYYLQDGPVWIRAIWPKPESFNWFLKNNRKRLTKQGGIIRLGRDYFVEIEVFPNLAKEILGLQTDDPEVRA